MVGMKRGWGRIVGAWGLVALWTAAIWYISGDTGGANYTSGVIEPLLRWLFPEIGAGQLYRTHVAIRKLAHVTEYALLAGLAFRALRLTIDVSLPRVALLTLALVLAVAGVDELRQSFVPTRTGSPRDVALDFLGGAVGVGLIVAVYRRLGIGAPVPREGA